MARKFDRRIAFEFANGHGPFVEVIDGDMFVAQVDGSGHVVIELPLLWLGGRLNLSWRAHGTPEQRTT